MRYLVVSYDIVDDQVRAKLARFLRGYLDHVQKSVFEGPIEERFVERLRRGIEKLIQREQDSVRIYTLCARCRPATEVIGVGKYVPEGEGDVVL